MTILGVDPGLNATGYGVIAASADRLRLVAAGRVSPSSRRTLAQRLHQLYEGLHQVIKAHQPRLMVLESLYIHHQYLTTAAMMAHARGIACLLSAQYGLPLIEYLPTRIKKALTGYGTASKEQVSRAVGMWLQVDASTWSADATDALALAIAHAHISKADGMLKGVDRTRRRRSMAVVMA